MVLKFNVFLPEINKIERNTAPTYPALFCNANISRYLGFLGSKIFEIDKNRAKSQYR